MEYIDEQHHKGENRHRHQQRDKDFADQVFAQCFHDVGRAARKCLILPVNQAQLLLVSEFAVASSLRLEVGE